MNFSGSISKLIFFTSGKTGATEEQLESLWLFFVERFNVILKEYAPNPASQKNAESSKKKKVAAPGGREISGKSKKKKIPRKKKASCLPHPSTISS